MSDTETINFNEESKLRGSVVEPQRKEHKDILAKLEIPALVDVEIAQTSGGDVSESKIKFKQQLDEVASDAQEVIDSLKSDYFSPDPDFLEPQIIEAEKKLEDVSKDLWVKLELTDYKDPANYYEMIKTTKSIFRKSLKRLIQEEKIIKSKELSDDLKDLYISKANIEDKLIELYK